MSTDIQLKGDSLRRQKERSKRYAEENDLELIENFKLEDIGISAFKGDNVTAGALGKFLEAVKSGQIPKGSYLLVESFDRLSRQKLNAAVPLFLDITSSGINLVTLSDNQLYRAGETDFPQLILSIVMMARANEKSEIKSQRVSAAWKAKRDAIAEKKLTKLCPAWLELSEDQSGFRVHEERAGIVKRIFEESAGGQGTFVITRRLNAACMPPFGRSKGWVQTVRIDGEELTSCEVKAPAHKTTSSSDIHSQEHHSKANAKSVVLPKGLVRQWEAANGNCRGGSGDDPKTLKACDVRETLARQLEAAKWCYGKEGQSGYQYKWHRCQKGSIHY